MVGSKRPFTDLLSTMQGAGKTRIINKGVVSSTYRIDLPNIFVPWFTTWFENNNNIAGIQNYFPILDV